ncbi:MAG: hypothetical protein U0354_15410 [Candidatus Sericytochromatia bacterium]
MTFFSVFKSVFTSKLIDEIIYNPDVHEVIDEFSQVVIMGDTTRKYYTLQEMMNWFSEKFNENSRAYYAFAKMNKLFNGNSIIVLCLLDIDKKILVNNNKALAIKIESKEIDVELAETFKNTSSIIFN